MSQSLEECYERALLFLEETAPVLARAHPAQAGSLLTRDDVVADPHLERLIEGCALLAGRVDHKISNEFPGLIESLLQVVYPHLQLIVPALAIAQLSATAPVGTLRDGVTVPAGSALTSAPIGRQRIACRYRTGYDTTLWPLQVQAAQWQSPVGRDLAPPPRSLAALRLLFSCPGGLSATDLPIDRLRLFLHGDRQLVIRLYEAMFLQCRAVEFRLLAGPVAGAKAVASCMMAPGEALAQVGLDLRERLLPMPPQVFPGFGHLIEMLSFPSKYWFVDFLGWQRLAEVAAGEAGSAVEVVLYFPQTQEGLERGLSEGNFLLDCTPIVNLFSKSTEPIDFNHRQSKYWVVPSRAQPEGHEVYMIEDVQLFDAAQDRQGRLLPFYAPRFQAADTTGYWIASRRAAVREDIDGRKIVVPGTEVDVQIVDRKLDINRPTNAVLNVQALCTNRDVPTQAQGGDTLMAARGTAPVRVQGMLVAAPTHPLRPPLADEAHWRLLSHNALNHVSLIDGEAGREALQELLRLCDFTGAQTKQLAAINHQAIEGITLVRSRPIQGRVYNGKNLGYCMGRQIELELDERNYGGAGVLLFASVLERFFGLYASINSFVQVVARTTQSKDILKQWPHRTAEQILQ